MLQFTPYEAERLKKRAKEWPGALDDLKEKCAFFFQNGIKVPVGTKSTWVMFYECPKDSAKLVYDYAKEDEYVCPVCGGVYTGEPYAGAWWRYTVEKVVDHAWLCAVIWMLTGEEPYFAVAKEVLTRFADNYAGYELHGGIPYNNPGRISSQTLCEAMALRSLCMSYDILRDALPLQSREHIEKDLLAQSAQVLVEQRMNQIHNHEVIVDGALGMAGLLLDRQDFLAFAIESKYGLRYQLTHGVLADGLWFEGTLHYHYFTLYACMLFEKFAHGTPYSLRDMGVYEKMYRMPLNLLQPDFHTPCLGDGGNEGMFEELAEHYEYPYRIFQDAYMAQMLNTVYAHSRRGGIQAFLFGADVIESTSYPAQENYHDENGSGFTVLRGPEGKYLLFKHGKYGGEHDHYDKLGIHFMANGVCVADDLGTVGYGAPHHYAYFKNTFTHNTVCINGLNQPPADGRVVQYLHREDGVLVEAHADWCGKGPELDSLVINQWDMPSYEGVTMRRAILFGDDYFVEAFLIRGAKGRVVDWVIHPQGKAELPGEEYRPAEVRIGGSVPQSFLHGARSFVPQHVTETRWYQESGTFRLFSALNRPGEMIYAEGPNNPPSKDISYAVYRTVPKDADVVFMHVFAFGKAGEKITRVVLQEEAPGEILAEVTLGEEKCVHRFTIGK